MKKDEVHIKKRNEIEILLNKGLTIDEIAQIFKIPLGTRYEQGMKKAAQSGIDIV